MNIMYLSCAIFFGGLLVWLLIGICVASATITLDEFINTKTTKKLKDWQYILAFLSTSFAVGAGVVLALTVFAAAIVCVYKFITPIL